MNDSSRLLMFALDEQRYALHLSVVDRIARAVELTPLPQCPEIVMGVINVGGLIVPVVDIRRRFRLPEREMELSDQFVIARTAKRTVALVVDSVSGIVTFGRQDTVSAGEVLPNIGYVQSVAKLPDGMVLIHDLDGFLSLEEEHALDSAMSRSRDTSPEPHNPERHVSI